MIQKSSRFQVPGSKLGTGRRVIVNFGTRNSEPGTRNFFSGGQALVEVALIFPIFLIVVFGVMQMGHIATMTLVVNHAAFEVARIGAIASEGIASGDEVSCSQASINKRKMLSVARGIFDRWPGRLVEPLDVQKVKTLNDPEVDRPNCDITLTLRYKMPLIFPFVNVMLARPPYGGYDPEVGMFRLIVGESRMPLEVPIWY
ncbi:MAG: pilus assembly protein [Elusimicrobia bacterium]|nr:pilus assembly protein [Elusimicrobiota bacterium]